LNPLQTSSQDTSQDNILEKILVLIPALNEEATISSIVKELRELGISHIRVIDNGSTDHTTDLATMAGAEILHESRRGYGQACWTGLQVIPASTEWILFCDADGSDDLTQIPLLLKAAEHADFVVGNRRSTSHDKASLTAIQNFGNALATTLIHWCWGFRYHDLGPLRLIRRESIERMKMQDRGFGWTVEMQVRAIEMGLRIVEVPVNYRIRQGGRSKISGTLRGTVNAGTIILLTLAKLCLRRILP
jgi:glycosyltransferase involved in cell wall biosynthesis